MLAPPAGRAEWVPLQKGFQVTASNGGRIGISGSTDCAFDTGLPGARARELADERGQPPVGTGRRSYRRSDRAKGVLYERFVMAL